MTAVMANSRWFYPLPAVPGVEAGISVGYVLSRVVPGFDGLDGVFECPFQNAPADGPEHEAKPPPLEVLAIAYDDHVNVGRTVGLTREGVGVARRASPHVGVGRLEDDAVGIGPVVVQAFPDAARAFGDVGL